MAIYRFDLAEVDTARRSLRVNGVTRDIGSRAFDLLVTLIEARDRVLNKDWLLEHIWPDVVVEEGNLYVQISTLRRVIGAKSIATVSGRGYQFTGELLSSAPPVVASAIPLASAGIPSIAVLPFKAPGISEDRAHLVEGIVEAIVTGLSQMPRLNVIGSGSSLSYKGREVDVRAVGRELAVRYVLGGSVRVGSDRLRLNAQLVESEGAKTLWAEQLDGAPQDLLDFSDDLTTRVVMAIVPSGRRGRTRSGVRNTPREPGCLRSLPARVGASPRDDARGQCLCDRTPVRGAREASRFCGRSGTGGVGICASHSAGLVGRSGAGLAAWARSGFDGDRGSCCRSRGPVTGWLCHGVSEPRCATRAAGSGARDPDRAQPRGLAHRCGLGQPVLRTTPSRPSPIFITSSG